LKKGPKLIYLFCCKILERVEAYEDGASTFINLSIGTFLPIVEKSFALPLTILFSFESTKFVESLTYYSLPETY
jgi:hypothetical protein